MAVKKTVFLGVGTALAAGVLLTTLVSTQTSRAEESTYADMTVPIGRIGDQVTYATFERNDSSEKWAPRPAWAFRVDSLAAARDGALIEHKAVRIVSSKDAWSTEKSSGPGLADTTYSAVSRGGTLVALEGREVVAYDEEGEAKRVEASVLTTRLAAAGTSLGPFPLWWSSMNGRDQATGYQTFLPLAYQNRTYALGQEIPRESLLVVAQRADLYDQMVVLANLSQTGRVADHQKVDGLAALDLRAEGCLDAALTPGSSPTNPMETEGIPFLHTVVPLHVPVCYTIDVWVSGDRAYPVLYQESTTVDGTRTHEWLEVLADIHAGQSGRIPWDDSKGADRFLPFAPGLEWGTGDEHYPTEGSHSRLPYRLSEALASLAADPTMTSLADWRARHPDATIVGYRLYPTRDGPYWTLVYGTMNREGFVVESQKGVGALVVTNRAIGEVSIRQVRPSQIPTGQLTLAAAEDLYSRVYRDDPGSQPPDTILWGLQYADLTVNRDCLFNASDKTKCAPYTGMMGGNSDMLIGRWPERVAAGADVQGYAGGPRSYQWVGLDPSEGYVYHHGHALLNLVDVTPAAGGNRDPPAQAAMASATQRSVLVPDLSPAVLISTSLVAAFLTAYFWPVIRFFGTNAAGTIFGYAKLRRSNLLEKKTREDLFGLIKRDPGITTSELAKTVAAGWSTTVYHLCVLEKNKLSSSLVDGRHKRFFPVEDMDWSARERMAVLKNARTKELYQGILEEPGVIQGVLARRAGMSSPAAYWHLRRLEGAGLVGRDKLGRRVHYYPADSSRAAAAESSMEVA